MKYLQVVIVLVAVIAALSQVTDGNTDDKVTVDVTISKECVNVTLEEESDLDAVAKNPFVAEFNKEKSPIEVADALFRRHRITISKVFSIRSWKSLYIRANLPFLKAYIAGRTEQFHKLDLPTVFQLLGKIGQVLRVAYAGCKGYNCEKSVIEVMRRYQNLITDTTRLSKYMVNRCILSLKYHKYAYSRRRYRERAIKGFYKTIPIARLIKNNSQEVVTETNEMRELSKKASNQANTDLAGSKAEKDAYKAKMKLFEDERIKYSENVNSLKKQVDDYRVLIDKLKDEEKKIDTKEEFVRKKSVLSLKCQLVQTPRFKEICQTVVVLFIGVKECKIHKAMKTEQECTKQLDKDLLEFRKEQLTRLAKLRKEMRDKRLNIEEKKLEVQVMQRQQFAELQKTGKRLSTFKNLAKIAGNNLEIARASLELADRSMIIVQTQLKKMVEFWDNVVQHTSDIVREARDNTTDDDPEGLKEKILASGFSWIALGNVLRTASQEMRKTTYQVDDAFMTFPTTKEVRNVIQNEGEQILAATVELASKYEERIKETEDKIKALQCRNKIMIDGDGDGDIDIDDEDFDDEDIDGDLDIDDDIDMS